MSQLIVPMQGADVTPVLALERQIYAFPWTRGNFTDSLAAGYSAWLLRRNDELAAYAVMMQAGDEAQLLNISVAPAQQRAGLGSTLFAHLRAVAAAAGGERLFLEVRRSNAAALSFYARHGFATIGERRAYYAAAGGREDALVMELRL